MSASVMFSARRRRACSCCGEFASVAHGVRVRMGYDGHRAGAETARNGASSWWRIAAHRPLGHFPNRFAELAAGFVENGCTVETLTAQGWLHDGERPVPFVVNRYGWFNRLLCRAGESFARTRGLRRRGDRPPRARHGPSGRGRGVAAPATRCRTSSSSAWASTRWSRAPSRRRGRWLFYAFGGPLRSASRIHETRGAARVAPARGRWARAHRDTGRRRTARAGRRSRRSSIPVTLSITGVRAPRTHSATRSVVSGSTITTRSRSSSVPRTATRTSTSSPACSRSSPTGNSSSRDRPPTSTGRERAGAQAIVIGGYVDTSMRDVVYSAADLVVLSFRPSFRRNSGVLVDAISLGVPVVCSDGSIAADVVREYNLGVVFAPGNPDSLERAVKIAPSAIDPADLQRARTELSNRAVAARFLDALEYCSTGRGRPVMTTTQATNIVDYKNGAGHDRRRRPRQRDRPPRRLHRSRAPEHPGAASRDRARAHAASGRLPHAGDVGPDGARAPGDPGRERRRRPPARHGP